MSAIRSLPNRDGLYFVVDGVRPRARDLDKIVRKRLGVHVIRAPDDSLEFLSPIMGEIEKLIVAVGVGSDVRALSGAHAMRELALWTVNKEEVDFSAMTRLQRFAGFGKRISGLRSLESLTEAYIEGVRDETLADAVGRFNEITVTRASALSGPPKVTYPEGVHSLLIHGSRGLDLSALSRYAGLKKLTLTSCKRLTGLTGLLRLDLDFLELDQCAYVEDLDLLLNARAAKVNVGGLNPFTEQFRERAERERPGVWQFPKGGIVRG